MIDQPTIWNQLGDKYDTLEEAQAATSPSATNDLLSQGGLLIGRAIVEYGNATPVEIANAADLALIGGGGAAGSVSSHNDLAGIQGGAPGEKYHISDITYVNGWGSKIANLDMVMDNWSSVVQKKFWEAKEASLKKGGKLGTRLMMGMRKHSEKMDKKFQEAKQEMETKRKIKKAKQEFHKQKKAEKEKKKK